MGMLISVISVLSTFSTVDLNTLRFCINSVFFCLLDELPIAYTTYSTSLARSFLSDKMWSKAADITLNSFNGLYAAM